jgi:hypothetical protein
MKMSFLATITLILIILKLFGIIQLSWLWIILIYFSPILIALIIVIFVILCYFICLGITSVFDKLFN